MFLFGLTLFFTSCADEKDLLSEPQAFGLFSFPKQKASVLKGDQVPQSILNFIDTATHGSHQVRSSKSSKGFVFADGNTKSETFGTIDNSQSVMVNLNTQTRYSFLVIPNEPNSRELINLVIIEDATQTEEFFVKYQFDTDYEDSSVDGWIDLSLLSGTVSYFNADGDLTGQFELGQTRSRNNFSGTGLPCPPEDEDETTDENNDGNAGSGCIAGVNCEDDSNNDDEQNTDGNDGSTGGGGGGEICQMEITYYPCACGGEADGHLPTEAPCCAGSPTVVTFTCEEGRSSEVDGVHCDDEVGVIFGHRKECEKITDFLNDPDNANFKQKLLDYSSPNNAAQYLDVNFEFSTTIHEYHTEIEERQGDPSTRSADVSYTMFHSNRIKGWVHTHHDGVGENGTYSIFSFEDLIAISIWLANDKLKSDKFVAFLITKKGNDYTRYAITINNKNRLNEFFLAYKPINFTRLSNQDKIEIQESFEKSNTLRDKYYNYNNAKIKAYNTNSQQIMKKTMAFMHKGDLGISLFKANETFSNFTQVTLKNPSQGSASDIKERDCN